MLQDKLALCFVLCFYNCVQIWFVSSHSFDGSPEVWVLDKTPLCCTCWWGFVSSFSLEAEENIQFCLYIIALHRVLAQAKWCWLNAQALNIMTVGRCSPKIRKFDGREKLICLPNKLYDSHYCHTRAHTNKAVRDKWTAMRCIKIGKNK